MKNRNVLAKSGTLFIALILSTWVFGQKAPLERSRPLAISKIDSTHLVGTWNSFLEGIRTRNYEQIRGLSLKKVYCNAWAHILPGPRPPKIMPIDSFINRVVIRFYDTHFIKVLSDSVYHIMATVYPDRKVSNFKLINGKKLILYDIYFIDYVQQANGIKDQNYYVFHFVKDKDQYKFFGIQLESPH